MLFFFVNDASAADSGASDDKLSLLLELWVNDHTRHIIAPVVEDNGVLLVSAKDLGDAGIKTTPAEVRPDGNVDLYKLPGVNIEMSDIEQKLLLRVSSERLIPQAFDLKPESGVKTTTSGTGFLGQYDLVGTVDNIHDSTDSSAFNASLGGTLFSSDGNLTTNGFSETTADGTRMIRLDSYGEVDEPDSTRKWIAGDSISGSRSWSRSVRFGGVQLATDFSLRPDLNTMPLPNFFGQTAVPANVDVFINSARVFESGVEPGPFQLNNLPVITGNGEASVVVRDDLGRETVMQLPFYASQDLLRKGLSSYDIEAGAIRQDYGVRSFDYGAPVASGSYSEGIDSSLTLESHGEAAQYVQLVGGGAVISLAPYGVLHPAIAASNSEHIEKDGEGTLYSLALQGESLPLGYFGSVGVTQGNYNDLASLGNGTPPPHLQMQVGSNYNLGKDGVLAASFITTKDRDQEISHISTASYSLSLGAGFNTGLTGFYDHSRHDLVTEAFVSFPLGDGLIGSGDVQRGRRTEQAQASITQQANPDGGFGYRITGSAGDNNYQEADATWNESHGTLQGSVAMQNGAPAIRLDASGGLALIDGALYTIRQPNGAVALVRTGQPNIGILQENRQVAVSDDEGEALLTGLVPFTDNHIAIDPTNYSFDTLIEDTDKTVTPSRNGVIVDFTPTRHVPAMVELQMPDGSYPPAGSQVVLNNANPGELSPSAGGTTPAAEPLIMGRHGELFVPDMPESAAGHISYTGGSCSFSAAAPAASPDGAIPSVGPVYCKADAAP